MKAAPRISECEELPCIWMLAGILSYRLCDRNYECDGCELFHALGGAAASVTRSAPPTGPDRPVSSAEIIDRRVNAYISELTSNCRLHLDRYYCPCHLWLHGSEGGEVLIGLDGQVLRVLYPLSEIILPRAGVWMRRSEPCGWITRGKMSLTLRAPVAAEVDSVNDRYLAAIRDRGSVSDADDWLMRVRAHEELASLPDLFRGEEALVWYLKKIQIVKRHLKEALAADERDLGVTLSDGGRPNLDVEQVLGCDRYERLVEEMFELQI